MPIGAFPDEVGKRTMRQKRKSEPAGEFPTALATKEERRKSGMRKLSGEGFAIDDPNQQRGPSEIRKAKAAVPPFLQSIRNEPDRMCVPSGVKAKEETSLHPDGTVIPVGGCVPISRDQLKIDFLAGRGRGWLTNLAKGQVAAVI